MDAENEAKHTYAHCPNDEENDMLASIYSPLASVFLAASYLALLGACCKEDFNLVCATLSISADKELLHQIRTGYAEDKWVKNTLAKAKDSMPGIQLTNGLWYIGSRLIIPRMGDICETLFRLMHDVLGVWDTSVSTRLMVPYESPSIGQTCRRNSNRPMTQDV